MTEKRKYTASYVNDNLARKQVEDIYGNTVRKIYAVPEEQPQVTPKREEKIQKQPVKREKGLAASFGMAYSLVIATAVAVIFVNLVNYIALNIESTQKLRQITNLQKELTTATIENDNYEISINSSIDYDYIYKVATEELGMVYASKSQIITYDSSESEFVEQYKDIEN